MIFIDHELMVRFGAFIGVLMIMAMWEIAAPRRRLTMAKAPRWASNLGLVTLNALALRTLLPITAVGAVLVTESHNWGGVHLMAWPAWLAGIVAVIVLDLTVYLQHVLFHAVPALWRLHMVHHADPDIDVTTGLRFHTLEILISMGIKILVVGFLGPPVWAVILFEILLNATAMFNHSNIRMPGRVDRLLRLVVVTPDMHRVHHSVIPSETNTNFGFNLPWWDRLLGTYRPRPAQGHENMTIGLAHLRGNRVVRLHWMLLLPFVRKEGNDPISSPPDNLM